MTDNVFNPDIEAIKVKAQELADLITEANKKYQVDISPDMFHVLTFLSDTPSVVVGQIEVSFLSKGF